MAITKFPIDTEEPRVNVTLPVGEHVLELVVEDSAGIRSEPDRVTITVEREQPPARIEGIRPSSIVPDGNPHHFRIRGQFWSFNRDWLYPYKLQPDPKDQPLHPRPLLTYPPMG